MAAVGGSIETLTMSGRDFSPAADADVTRKLGGFENEVQANGDGTARLIKTRTTWSLDGFTIQIDADAGDHEFLQSLADGNDYFPVAVTYPGGEVYQGTGIVTGELAMSNQSATATVSLMGPGTLTKQ